MNMPSDFAPKNKKRRQKRKLWLVLWIGIVLFALYSAVSFLNSFDKHSYTNNKKNVDDREIITTEPPPQEYDFYERLPKEKAKIFSRQLPVEREYHKEYFLLIEYFLSYDTALERSKELTELKVIPIKVEPFGSEIKFRLRVGPYLSRSKMNSIRDILFHYEIPHRVIVQER